MSAKQKVNNQEWSQGNIINLQNGCEHNCRYCYAKALAIRYKRNTPEGWSIPQLNTKFADKGFGKRSKSTMLPSAHDITVLNIDYALHVLKKLLEPGNKVLIVMKPEFEPTRSLCDELSDYTSQLLFRFTICSADSDTLRYWEPGAPCFEERLKSLQYANDCGFATSVSCEPMLDTKIEEVVDCVRPYVTDSIWLGIAPDFKRSVSMNCPGDTEAVRRAEELVSEVYADEHLRKLYEQYGNNPLIKWKSNLQVALGIEG